uniref:Uncharacterized protein n=1 Tax=Setaria viridis TaxID=4556 RepID=A0A4U6VME9_SETVI|nr:hypothetical protein SEVIR_2G067750v2 [Setaria viridis]
MWDGGRRRAIGSDGGAVLRGVERRGGGVAAAAATAWNRRGMYASSWIEGVRRA